MVVRSVRDIPHDQKHSLEHLLGESLREDQRVCVIVFPSDIPEETVRLAASEELHRFLDEAERRAEMFGITSEEADAAVEEAMQSVRRRS